MYVESLYMTIVYRTPSVNILLMFQAKGEHMRDEGISAAPQNC